ncbi:MAG: zinc ribbon domain-containing protein [Anaerolineales bacterium]|nr:zinc ribbon domain-containing protein [Anaerolineales bacterium]MCB9110675.1 zinc ribbon domain-containing protein [Anaerolineales bacterium]
MFCQNCGTEYDPKKVRFCATCGEKFHRNETKKELIQSLNDIENEQRGYVVLQILSLLLIVLGWGVIIGGWACSFYLSNPFSTAEITLPNVQGTVIQSTMNYAVLFGGGIVSTIIGLSMVASGQVYLAFLDLRNDTYTIKEFIRLYIEERNTPT